MVVDKPIPADAIPSSQPDADEVVVSRPASPAWVDDAPHTGSPSANLPPKLIQHFADVLKWQNTDFSALTLVELNDLPEIVHVAALQRGISIFTLKQSLLNI